MHRRQLNHARLGLVIRPRGPILVKSGRETPDPTRPEMEFVRTRHARLGETVYLPGTSLKGAVRAHTERVLRGLGLEVCDPLGSDRCKAPKAEGHESPKSPAVFTSQCPACRTFGSLELAGRAHLLDAYPWPPGATEAEQASARSEANATETRWQVAIDRESGRPRGGALYDLEVVVRGAFFTEVHLRNFQLWQLGVVAAVLRDLDAGDVALGFGKARGLGQVAVEWNGLRVDQVEAEGRQLRGTAALCHDDERSAYDLHAGEDAVDLSTLDLSASASEDLSVEPTWRGSRLVARGPALDALFDAVAAGPLAKFVAAWKDRRTPRSA